MTTQALPVSSFNGENGKQKAPLTKSQKKRMKRKAAAAKTSQQQQEQNLQPKAKNNGSSLNPHVKLRMDLAELGHDAKEIDSAIEEMWNMQLQYDEFESVKSHLESRRRGREMEEATLLERMASLPPQQKPTPLLVVERKEDGSGEYVIRSNVPVEDASTGSTSTARTFPMTSSDESVVNKSHTNKHDSQPRINGSDTNGSVRSPETNGISPLSASSSEIRKQAPQQMKIVSGGICPDAGENLASKLEMVGNYGNLHDSLFSLTEWTTKVAKTNELKILCNRTNVLQIILQRCIVECPSNVEYANLLPSITLLFSSLFKGAPESKTTDAITKILKGARKAVAICPPPSSTTEMSNGTIGEPLTTTLGDGADMLRVAALDARIAAIVSSAVVELVKSANASLIGGDHSGSPTSVKQVEKEIDELESSISQTAPKTTQTKNKQMIIVDVLQLMTRRDKQKLIAEKADMLAEIAVRHGDDDGAGDSEVKEETSEKTSEETSSEQVDLFNDKDEEVGLFFRQNRVEFQNTCSELDRVETEFSGEKETMEKELQSCHDDKERITLRREEILRELKQLEEEEMVVIENQQSLEIKLDETLTKYSMEKIDLESRREGKRDVVKVADVCHSVSGVIQQLKHSLAPKEKIAEDLSSLETNHGFDGNTVEKKIGDFYLRMCNYFRTEADCVDFLKERLHSLQIRMQGLEHNISECRMLGMATNVSQMTQSLMDLSRNAAEDESAINSLLDEAKQMKHTLLRRMEEFASGQHSISPHAAYLNDIVMALSCIGLEAGDIADYIPVADVVAIKEQDVIDNNGDDEHDDESSFSHQNDISLAVTNEDAPLISNHVDNDVEEQSSNLENNTHQAVTMNISIAPAIPVAVKPTAPKFSWAAPKSIPQKSNTKTLREIQMEEMNAKKDGIVGQS